MRPPQGCQPCLSTTLPPAAAATRRAAHRHGQLVLVVWRSAHGSTAAQCQLSRQPCRAQASGPEEVSQPPPTRHMLTTQGGSSTPRQCAASTAPTPLPRLAQGSGTGGDPAPAPAQQPQQQQPRQQQRMDSDVWHYKPSWCQPYSIIATGAAVVGGVWAASGGSPWWSAAAAAPVLAWWFLFLGVMPAQFREYAEAANAELQQQQQQQQQYQERQRQRQERQG